MSQEGPASTSPIVLAPPPWHLTGEGIIVIGRTIRDELGILMLVRYGESGVGPYDEALWIPLRKLRPPHSITAIRVSSQSSVDKGREYWGIPKKLARFDWLTQPTRPGEAKEEIRVRVKDTAGGTLSVQLEGEVVGPAIPVNTAWIPQLLFQLEQTLGGRHFRFIPRARGKLKWMRGVRIKASGDEFPEIAHAIVSVRVPCFEMTFPAATIR